MAILSRFILKEKISGRVMIGIGVATSGVLLLVSHGDFTYLGWLKSVGDWLVLGSAFTWALYTIAGVIALLFLAVMGTALAQWIWQVGVAKLGASKAGIFLYLEPVATTVLAVPYMGERFGIATAIGGLLVLSGVYLAERK
jgi:drug/metabolite transporter (DMT)-like permease